LEQKGKKGIYAQLQMKEQVMALSLKLDAIEDLPRTSASDVKKLGWRGIMKAVGRKGRVVVTNHNELEAVILSAEEYGAIMGALHEARARSDEALDALRHRFDERLASLQAADAGDRLRGVMRGSAKLGGKVKVGASH
jgi:PHD/YefM family antitoxin component YafN of YafNO toxin-antitoxin module